MLTTKSAPLVPEELDHGFDRANEAGERPAAPRDRREAGAAVPASGLGRWEPAPDQLPLMRWLASDRP
jgi:hypothetical protein